jgi:hypothetical protein
MIYGLDGGTYDVIENPFLGRARSDILFWRMLICRRYGASLIFAPYRRHLHFRNADTIYTREECSENHLHCDF